MGVNGGGITGGLCTAPDGSDAGEQLLIQLSPIFKGCNPGFSTAFDSYARNDGDTVFTRTFHGKKYLLQHNNLQNLKNSFELRVTNRLLRYSFIGIPESAVCKGQYREFLWGEVVSGLITRLFRIC